MAKIALTSCEGECPHRSVSCTCGQSSLLWWTIVSSTGPMWYHFLSVLSINQSTERSIGLMMNGIEARPIAVVVHRRAPTGSLEDFWRSKLVKKQIRLMVKPGIATEARPCQISVSSTAWVTFVLRSEASAHGL